MKKEERLITIACVTGLELRCDAPACEEMADYMGGGRTCCTFHWVRNDLIPHTEGTVDDSLYS